MILPLATWFTMPHSQVELEMKVHMKVRNHGEGPYQGLLLVESGYYRIHI